MKKIILVLIIIVTASLRAEKNNQAVDFDSLSKKYEVLNNQEIELAGKITWIQLIKAPKGFLVAMDLSDNLSKKKVRIIAVLKDKNGMPEFINCKVNDLYTAKGTFKLNPNVKDVLGVISIPNFIPVVCQKSLVEISRKDLVKSAPEYIKNVIPLYSQSLEISVSKNWNPQKPNSQTKIFSQEFLPKNEKIETWNQLLTIAAAKGLSAQIPLDEIYTGEMNAIKKICPGGVRSEKVQIPKVSGFDTLGAIMTCDQHPQVKSKNEAALYIFVKGKNDIYIVKKSFREELNDKSLDRLSRNNYTKKAPELLSLRLCKNKGQNPVCMEDSPN
ncbi:MAG: hypothetical protein H7Z71_04650 [Moraxellaceae bacterium]|nr:hypothetical protein [Pseudobdellovibrionaceae bacterium]